MNEEETAIDDDDGYDDNLSNGLVLSYRIPAPVFDLYQFIFCVCVCLFV